MTADLIGPLLRDVSRSFYLTLRVLPREIRPQISLAYLLARASDTIADAGGVERAERVAILREFSEGRASARRFAERLGVAEATPSEAKLLEHLPAVLESLATFSADDRSRIWELLQIIVSGQIFDLERFHGKPLTDDELDRYTYMVAGCVGEFWTKMCAAHVRGLEEWKAGRMEELGVRFGKGLQLVNVLRDIGEDRRRGRQYLPNLDDYQRWLDRAVEHLEAGWEYTLAIPPAQWRLRLACIWPICIGLRTIALLRSSNPRDPVRVAISRGGLRNHAAIVVRGAARLCARCGVWPAA